MIKLYDYFRSSASFRVRIALNLKEVAYEKIPVNLVQDGGQHVKPEYQAVNPQGLVPALVLEDDKTALTQSLAIIEYLEEKYPDPPLLPMSPVQRAKVRAFAQAIACEIHPLNNLRVLQYLTGTLSASEEAKNQWYHHWLAKGLGALEKMLPTDIKSTYCFGAAPTMADICLVPQIYNAKRYNFSLQPYPALAEIYENCMQNKAFADAFPDNQPQALS